MKRRIAMPRDKLVVFGNIGNFFTAGATGQSRRE